MKTLRLTRISTHPKQGTFGALTIDGTPFCVTLEPANMDNESNISCIPVGRYIIQPYKSPKYRNTWEVMSVPNRTYILIHAGNELKHTLGCIIVAKHFGKLHGKWAVLNSGTTFQALLKNLNGNKEAELIITESY